MLSSIAIHPVLLDLQSAHRDVVVLAYLDDIFLLGPPSKAMLAFDDLKSAFSNTGLEISNSKCELYCPPSTEIPASGHSHSLPVSTSGCNILGVPIGLLSFIQAHCSDLLLLEAYAPN